MADEHIQRPYRASQPPVRNASGQASGGPSDPLAELARLIGQNDPFAEYGHNGGRAPAVPNAAPVDYPPPLSAQDMHAAAAPAYDQDQYAADQDRYAAPPVQTMPFPPPPAPPPSAQYAQEGYGEPAYAGDPYAQGIVPGQSDQMEPSGYEQGPYYASDASVGAEEEHFYDDVPPRRRVGVLAIVAVLALAVIGTAGAFGYRALFGSSGSKAGPPPVIKADATPRKIVPAAQSKDPQSGKLITDRIANNQNEKLVSREEQPIDIKDKPVGTVLPQGQNGATPQAMLGTGVLGVEPKKIHTIAIRPSEIGGNPQAQPPAVAQAPARAQAASAAPAPPPPAPPRATAEPPPREVARAETPVQRAAPAAPANAPLSLAPNSSAPAQAAPRPLRTTSAPAPAPVAPSRNAAPTSIAPAASSGGGYAVQIVARHNEADAQASFRSLQTKYPQQLGGRAPLIRRVDLGAKGIYYRAMVGPFGNADEASQLCSTLKAAGGECIVQKI